MTTQVRKNVMDMFIDGARRGFTIATTNLLPNVVMAFVIIQALKITGLLDWVGHICEPVMALWGLPGEAATVLLAALMSMGGAVGVAASLATAGALTWKQSATTAVSTLSSPASPATSQASGVRNSV